MTRNARIKITAPASRFYKGPYGRLFPNLDPWDPVSCKSDSIECIAKNIANSMFETSFDLSTLCGNDLWDKVEELNAEHDNETVPAGYTYFGQFVDHDMTFDPSSSLMRRNDPNAINNFRTPRLDLDSVYGAGPDQDSYLYSGSNSEPYKFLTSDLLYEQLSFQVFELKKIGDLVVNPITVRSARKISIQDLQRNQEGTAILADKRNDENLIVSQLHLAFQLAHNKLVDRAIADSNNNLSPTQIFDSARNTLRWLYQYIVWFDFVKRITDECIFKKALYQSHCGCAVSTNRKTNACECVSRWKLGYDEIYSWKVQPFMPVEFSVAAYRLGHSMVRNVYESSQVRGLKTPMPIFGKLGHDELDNFKGGRYLPVGQAVQWDWFLDLGNKTKRFPQKSRRIDTKLSEALFDLPEDEVGKGEHGIMRNLAFRNLLRGYNFELPSGTSVARHLGFRPIDIDPMHDALWYYILKEAEMQPNDGEHLGKVGSTIVCSTFAGILKGDPSSYFSVHPNWTPYTDPLLGKEDLNENGEFDLSSIIRIAGLNISSVDQ